MKKISYITAAILVIITITGFSQSTDKLISSKTHIKFFSSTSVEDIEANNYTSISTINKQTGDLVFSVPMQGFEFEKSLMQKHYNSDKFLNTKEYPKSKLKSKIVNLDKIDFTIDGTYPATIEGEMTVKGVTKPIKEEGTINVKGDVVIVNSKFNITLTDYGIVLDKGKIATAIAKTLEITVLAEYK